MPARGGAPAAVAASRSAVAAVAARARTLTYLRTWTSSTSSTASSTTSAPSRRGGAGAPPMLGPKLGAALLGATLYELEPGERTFPYHYEWGCEEWLLVVAGTPTLRTPEGERELAPGDTVCFPEGPAGAHLVSNAKRQRRPRPDPVDQGSPCRGRVPRQRQGRDLDGRRGQRVVPARHRSVDYWDGRGLGGRAGPGPTTRSATSRPCARSGAGTRARARPAASCGSASCPRR